MELSTAFLVCHLVLLSFELLCKLLSGFCSSSKLQYNVTCSTFCPARVPPSSFKAPENRF